MKNISNIYYIVFIIFISVSANAQYNDIVNSNRPGLSISPYNVGKGNLVIETGIAGYKSTNKVNEIDATNNKIGLDVTLRYALEFNLELFTELYLGQSMYEIADSSSSYFSVSPMIFGASYRFNQGDGLMPTVALRGGLMLYKPSENENYKTDLDLILITYHDIATNWAFITNTRVQKVSEGGDYGFTASVTNSLSENTSWFIEDYIEYHDSEMRNFVNVGMAYLVNNNTQLDFMGGFNTDFNNPAYYFSVGLSLMIDRKSIKSGFNNPKGSGVSRDVLRRFRNQGLSRDRSY